MGIKSSKNNKKDDKKIKEKPKKKDINKNNKNKIIDLNSIQKLEPKFNNDYMLINNYKNNFFLHPINIPNFISFLVMKFFK